MQLRTSYPYKSPSYSCVYDVGVLYLIGFSSIFNISFLIYLLLNQSSS